MKTFTIALASLTAVTLAGCDSSSSSDDEISRNFAITDGFAEFVATKPEALAIALEAEDASLIEGTELPTGTATYSGIIAIEAPDNGLENDLIVGDLSVDVAFSDNSFDGEATDFVDAAAAELGGELSVTNGVIRNLTSAQQVTGYTTSNDLSGNLTRSSDGATETLTVDAQMAGDFFGGDDGEADIFGGIVEGTIRSDDGASTTLSDSNSGFLAAD